MTQIQRIKYMERQLNQLLAALHAMNKALSTLAKARNAAQALSDYYGSAEWRKDFADDEAGLLPKDLKRGVLSEDGVWDVMSENQVLLVQMRELLRATSFDISQE